MIAASAARQQLPLVAMIRTAAIRQAAELALIPALMLRVADGFPAYARNVAKVVAAIADLKAAKDAPATGLDPIARMDVALIAQRLVDDIAIEAKFTDRLGLVAFHIAKVLTDAEVIAIGDGSPLARALDVMLPALEPAAQNDNLDEAAQKQAVRSLRAAQRAGLFPDLSIRVA